MRRHAEQTSVSTDRSKAEIEKLVTHYGASNFASGWEDNRAYIMFTLSDRRIRFVLPLPEKGSEEFTLTPGRKYLRTPEESLKAWEQACRQRWRALALAIKAKLESAASNIETLEEAFLAQIVTPDNRTVAAHIIPAIQKAYETGQIPKMLTIL